MLPGNRMRIKNRFDALVVGAGPAGATAAFILARNGYTVGIIEKKKFPRFKLCGGLISQKTIQLLRDIFNINLSELKANGVIHYQSSLYGLSDRSGDCLKGKLAFPFYFVNRNRYDLQWLDQAVVAGAKVFFEEKVETVDLAGGKVYTRTGKQFGGRFIIAADGVFSRIRSGLSQRGLINGCRIQDIAAALEIFVPRETSSDFADYPNIYYGYTPWGYAWSFPGPHDQILGMCALRRKLRHPIARCFNEFLKAQGIAVEHFPKAKRYALPYGNYLHQAGYKNILLVGDAGGFADPFLGEGLYYAHKTAQLASAAIWQSFDKPQRVLKYYNHSLNRSVITELKYARIIRQILFSLPRRCHFKVLAFMLKRVPDQLAEAVQGQRSFKLLRPLTPI